MIKRKGNSKRYLVTQKPLLVILNQNPISNWKLLMIPVLLIIIEETLIEDYIEVVLIRQIVLEIAILLVTIVILTENIEK